MKAHELRALRHMALGIAEQCAALLEMLDGVQPTSETGEMPKALEDASDELATGGQGLPAMFGSARRAATVADGAAATGTESTKATD